MHAKKSKSLILIHHIEEQLSIVNAKTGNFNTALKYANTALQHSKKLNLKSATLLKSQSVAAQTAKNAIFLVWTDFLPCVG